jgi:hypothetical protein
MSKTYKDSPKAKAARQSRERHISVRAVRRDPPDVGKLSSALISLTMAKAEAAAQAETQAAAALPAKKQPLIQPFKLSKPDGSEGSDV